MADENSDLKDAKYNPSTGTISATALEFIKNFLKIYLKKKKTNLNIVLNFLN